VALEKCAEGVYLRGSRPRYPSEWLEEAVLRLEAGELGVTGLCVAFARAQCDSNRDFAFRKKNAGAS
jgi:hypothetical protein